MTLVVRGKAGAGPLATLLRDAVTEVDPTDPVTFLASGVVLVAVTLAVLKEE